MDEPVNLFPFSSLFAKSRIGPRIMDVIRFMYRIRQAMLNDLPSDPGQCFIIRFEDQDLSAMVCSGRGPSKPFDCRERFLMRDGQIYLQRHEAYPAKECLVTIFHRELFAQHHAAVLPANITHIIMHAEVYDFQSPDDSWPVADPK